MSNTRLTQRLIDALKPRKKTFDLRDTELKGFGVRVRCSGIKRYFVQSQQQGIRTWRIIGNAAGMTLEEARCHARSALASLHNGEEIIAATNEETRFGVVAEKLFEACERHWKVSTRRVNRNYLKKQILPWFRDMQVAGITELDVKQWHASLHATPFAADCTAPVLTFSSGRPRFTAIARRVPPQMSVSVDIEGADAIAFSRRTKCEGSAPYRHRIIAGDRSDPFAAPDRVPPQRNHSRRLSWSDYREGHL